MIGPRLDRPSAVGEEGRPRETSLAVASLTVVGLAVAAGVLESAGPTAALSGGVAAGTTAAGLALLDRDRFGPLCMGTLLALPVAVPLWILTLIGGGLRAGFGVAMLGLALTWTDTGDRDALERAVEHLGIGYGGLLLGTTAAAFLVASVPVLADPMFDRSSPAASLVAFLFWAGLAAATAYAVLRVVPVARLVPRHRRGAVRKRVTLGRQAAAVLAVLAIGASPVAAAVVPGGATGGTREGVLGLLPLLSSPLVLGPMLVAVIAGWLAVAVTAVLARVAGSAPGARLIAAVIVGVVVGVVLLLSPRFFGPSPVVAGVVLMIGPVVILLGVLGLVLAVDVGVVPSDASGTVLASAGLGVVTLSAGLGDLPGAYVFACAAGTVVVWDVSRFGLGLTRELGHVPETRRLELVHAVAVVGLGLVAAAVATLLYAVRVGAGIGGEATTAMALAVLGAVLVILPLRG